MGYCYNSELRVGYSFEVSDVLKLDVASKFKKLQKVHEESMMGEEDSTDEDDHEDEPLIKHICSMVNAEYWFYGERYEGFGFLVISPKEHPSATSEGVSAGRVDFAANLSFTDIVKMRRPLKSLKTRLERIGLTVPNSQIVNAWRIE